MTHASQVHLVLVVEEQPRSRATEEHPVAHDIVAPDDLDTGAGQHAIDVARAPIDRFERDAQLLLEDGHSMASAGLLAGAVGLAAPLPVEKGYDAVSGQDTRAFIDTGDEPRLSDRERGSRGVQAVCETILIATGFAAPAGRVGIAAVEGRAGVVLAQEGLAASRLAGSSFARAT